MPVPKAFLHVGSITFFRYLLDLHRGLVDRVMVVTREPGLYAGFDVELIGDAYPGRGPMVGVASALANAGGSPVLVTACDMPFLQPRPLAQLIGASAESGITVPAGPAGLEPLCCVYSPRVLASLESALSAGRMSLGAFIEAYDGPVRKMGPDELGMDMETFEKTFASVNTPEDYSLLVGGKT